MNSYNNYPPGVSDNTPDAPWNQSVDLDPIDVDVTVSITLSKETTVSTSDYTVEHWEDWDTDEEGRTIHTGGNEYDFSDCNFIKEFEEQHYSISELLSILREYAIADASGSFHTEERAKNIAQACEGWNVDEVEVVQ